MPGQHLSRGYTLIEVLVALVIISVGLLGMAGLQITSLKQNQSAYMRSQANILAYDIIDRMRANVSAVEAGSYFITSGTNTDECETTAGCTDAAMAAHDVFRWQAQLAAELTGGGGLVCRDADSSDSEAGTGGAADLTRPVCGSASDSSLPVVVYVWWNDERSSDQVSTRFALSTSL
ncbi:MAG: type IV pilus modification protein PilV [Pontibacterium sp.]